MNKTLRLWLAWTALAVIVAVGSRGGWTGFHKAMLVAVSLLGVLQLVLPALHGRMLRRLKGMSPEQRERFLARFDQKTQALLRKQVEAKPSADQWGVDQLKQLGDDLSLPHALEFQLSFSTQTNAEQATAGLRARGFGVAVRSDTQNGEWLCIATKTMIPDLAALQAIHTDLAAVAASFGGRYEGWGMAAEKQSGSG